MTKPLNQILIAEDVAENREALKLLLKFAGFACLEAADGRAAVETALREQPALVLMDLSLPEIDGLQAVRELRAAGASMPVIMVSAYDAPETQAQARAAGANDYVTKPLDFDHLKIRIAALLAAQAN
ncbi:MAG: response regulator transcription factor [Acidobacteria bacterium]|nr:response regulator transcription factor [Acidobacteriota bacterium]MBI3428168.1 response regulator transcription factor [Acidobacteriota bacterium]